MAPLCTLGLALWADAPQQEVTAVALCRELARVATGGADGSIWLWETPHSWHPLAQSRAMSQQKAGSSSSRSRLLLPQHGGT
jgi:hypothetical protein